MLGMASQPIFPSTVPESAPRPQPHPYDAAYVALAEAMRATLLTRPATRQSSRSLPRLEILQPLPRASRSGPSTVIGVTSARD